MPQQHNLSVVDFITYEGKSPVKSKTGGAANLDISSFIVIKGGGGGKVKRLTIKGGAAPSDDPTGLFVGPVETKCALGADGSDGVCSTAGTVSKVAEITGATGTPKEIIDAAKATTGCDSERCVLEKLKTQIGDTTVNKELGSRFKRDGPIDVSLLSNEDIDKTINQWRNNYNDKNPSAKFYNYGFNMSDYERNHGTLADVSIVELYNTGYRCAACVVNTDKSSGGGIHWMAIFVDMRSPNRWTVELFNSSGQTPNESFIRWLNAAAAALNTIDGHPEVKIIRNYKVTHQYTRTECGVYSLYYVAGRLFNPSVQPETYNMENVEIKDSLMFEVRQHLFNGADKFVGPDGNFKLGDFVKNVNVKWEQGGLPNHVRALIGGKGKK